MKTFKKFNKDKVEDIISYVNGWLVKYPSSKIAVGVDSQKIKKKNHVKYAVVIAMFYPNVESFGKGAHVIFRDEIVYDKMDLETRLMKEIEYTYEIAQYLIDNTNLTFKNLETHIDINPNRNHASNKVFKRATGWLEGCGFIVKFKPDAFVSSSLADSLVR